MATQLTKVTVLFVMPNGDDKDHDTKVQIVVNKNNANVIAENDDVAPDQHFPDPGTYGPYDIGVKDPSTTEADFLGGTTRMSIFPNGHDRWITDVIHTSILERWCCFTLSIEHYNRRPGCEHCYLGQRPGTPVGAHRPGKEICQDCMN